MTTSVVKMTWAEAKSFPCTAEKYLEQRYEDGRWRWFVVERELYPCPQHGHAMVHTKYSRLVIRLEVPRDQVA